MATPRPALDAAAAATLPGSQSVSVPFFPNLVPVAYPDGTLLKASGPQVDMMQGHERRWIPDPQTFNYLGLDWAAIRTIPDLQWATIPAGPPFPSRADGTLLKGSDPAIYVMGGGQRHWIPNPTTFNARGYDWGSVQTVADTDLNVIPLGTPVPQGGTSVQPSFPIVASQTDSFSGCGGNMSTAASIYASGSLNCVTHTWEVTDLRGFRGSVAVALLDQNQNTLWVSGTQHFGVDGRWFGTSDRTDNWSDNVPAAVLPNVRFIAIIQHWDPRNVYIDISVWLAGIGNVVGQLGSVIQGVTTIVSAL